MAEPPREADAPRGAGPTRADDPTRRAAARTATLIAIPIALAIGVLSLWRFGAFDGPVVAPSPTPLAAPSAPVSMPAAALAEVPAAACRAVIAHLPTAVRDLTRRAVTAGPEQNAAYGEPPVTLACGVAPATYASDAVLFPLSGVCYTVTTRSDSTVWTTVDRTVPIAVTVPGPQDGAAQSVIPFSAAIAANDARLPTTPCS